MQFGDRLKMLREEKNITQKQLGKAIHISDRVIGYYEANDRFPRDENVLKKMADYFNVSTDYLLGRTEVRAPVYTYEDDGKNYHKLDISWLAEEDVKYIDTLVEAIKAKRKAEQGKNNL